MRFHAIALLAFVSVVAGFPAYAAKPEKILPGMPPLDNPKNIYADAYLGMFSDAVKSALLRVYVPNSLDDTVTVIDPLTYKVVGTFATGKNPQHIVPSYDLKTLWVVNDLGNSVTPINPKTGKPGANVPVGDPYNLYYTPDGRYAIVVSEAHKRLDFFDTRTMKLSATVPVNCEGVNHMEFTADGNYAIATCEYSGQLLKLNVPQRKVVGYLNLRLASSGKVAKIITAKKEVHVGDVIFDAPGSNVRLTESMPQDIRSSPDGRTFFVADMMLNGVFIIDPFAFRQVGFIPTGIGAHSIYPSRDGSVMYVANRGCSTLNCPKKGPGSISLLNPVTKKVVSTWKIPGGGSPDMGNISADGAELWLSGRYDGVVYVFDTASGELTHTIAVGNGPHGLTYWPQPGRYSLGHTGNMR